MQRWEYKILEYSDGGLLGGGTDMEEKLNTVGNEGWELVGTITETPMGGTQTTKLIFKRPK